MCLLQGRGFQVLTSASGVWQLQVPLQTSTAKFSYTNQYRMVLLGEEVIAPSYLNTLTVSCHPPEPVLHLIFLSPPPLFSPGPCPAAMMEDGWYTEWYWHPVLNVW